MPPLPAVEIPIFSPPRSAREESFGKGKAPLRSSYKPRLYDDQPLPIKPSEKAPRNAVITSRSVDASGVNYRLKIGSVEINDVGVEEILDYVSALELEEYENREFEQERKVLEFLEAERERLKLEKLARMKERANFKGLAVSQSETATEEDSDEEEEETTGKHGRRRPTYTQFYLKQQPQTKGAIDFDSNDLDLQDALPSASRSGLLKRRRRKRDKRTGELLPLSPVAQEPPREKRRRRKRHPITNELMPLGWRYDPNAPIERQVTSGPSRSFDRLSIADGPEAKRIRLEAESDVSRSSTSAITKAEGIAAVTLKDATFQTFSGRPTPTKVPVIELLTSEDEPEIKMTPTKTAGPKPKSPLSSHKNNLMLQSAMLSSAAETSPEPDVRVYVQPPSASKPRAFQREVSPGKTSMLHSSAKAPSSVSGMENNDGDDGEEWFVEKIVDHTLSDPATHPPELGIEPVMLYQVVWDGDPRITWEPIDSFDDFELVNEYRKKVGLDPVPARTTTENLEKNTAVFAGPSAVDKNEDTSEDEEYEVERIIAHEMSDPRTHPKDLGRTPVMLYQIQWKGYHKLTWEPATSFADRTMLHAYNKRHGIMIVDDDDDETDDVA